MADVVGSVALKLTLDGSDLTVQFDKVTQEMQSNMQAPLDRVNKQITESFDKPMEEAQKAVSQQTEGIKKDFSKFNDEMKRMVKTGALSEIPEYLKSSDAKMPEPKTVDLSEVFAASSDPQELLKQKFENINLQIDAEREKLAQLETDFRNVEAGTKAFDTLSGKITASESKLISLQERLNTVTAKMQKTTSPEKQAPITTSNISNPQISEESNRLAELAAQLRNVEAGSKAFEVLSQKIAASQNRLNSLIATAQNGAAPVTQAANKTQNVFQRAMERIRSMFKKTTNDIKTEADKTSKKVSDSVKKSTDSSSKHMGALSQAIGGAFKATFLTAGLYAMFTGLRSLLTNAATQNETFKKSLNSVKANLMVAFTPIMQSIMPLLNTLMSGLASATKAIASFISALFGKSYAESVEATKGMQKNAETAKQTAESLSQASFDEMIVMSAPSSGAGTDGSGIDYDALDTNGDAAAASFAEKFKKVFEGIGKGFYDYVVVPIKENLSKFDAPIARFAALFQGIGSQCAAWMTPLSDWFQTDFKDAVAVSISTVSTILSGFMDTLATVSETVWNALVPVIDWFVTDGLPLFTDMWIGLMEVIGGVFDFLKVGFDTLWSGIVEPVFTLISNIILDCFTTFQNLWETYGQTTINNIMAMLESVKNIFLTVWNSFLKPIFDNIFAVLQQLWNDHLQPLIAHIGEFVMKLVNGAMEIYNQFIAPIVNWFVNVLGPPIAEVFNTIISMLGTVFGVLSDVLGGVFEALGGLIDFITGLFTGNWEQAWNGICTFFKGIWDAIWGIVKGVVNLIVDGINLLWKGIYTVVKAIVDAIGGIAGALGSLFGQDWHFSMPANPPLIPRLASGGIVDQPTLAMIGDNTDARSNPEVVAPLNKLKAMMGGADEEVTALLKRIVELLERLQLIVKIGDDTVAASAIRGINAITRMTGDCPILI